jgi:cholesterol transport system auxiliary component
MKPRRRALLAAAAVTPLWTGLAACGLAPAPAIEYNPLRDAGGKLVSPRTKPAIDQVLLLAAGDAPTLYDTDRMVFSRDASSLSYFQYGHWTEAPARSLLTLTEQRLAASGLYSSVLRSTSGVRGALLLTVRLDELYLDDATQPAQARVAFSVELLDWRRRSLIARRTFSRSQSVPARSAAGLAQAAAEAIGLLLDELLAWLAGLPPG